MRDEMGMPAGVSALGKVSQSDYEAAIPDLAAAAAADFCTEGNPVPASREDIAALYRAIW